MTKLSANRAAQEAGVAKKTLLEAMKSGRLTAEKNDKGHWEIDPSELFRCFPKQGGAGGSVTVSHPPQKTSENSAFEIEVKMLREQIEQLTTSSDRERRTLTDQIDDLRSRLDETQEQNKRLTALIPMRSASEVQTKEAPRKRRFFGLLAG